MPSVLRFQCFHLTPLWTRCLKSLSLSLSLANSGVDQRCPLSTCGFSAAVDPVLRVVLADICKQHDPGANLFAYLDWYLWSQPQYLLDTSALMTAANQISQPWTAALAATSSTTLSWVLDLTSHFSAFLHLRVTYLPGPDSVMCSFQVRQRRIPALRHLRMCPPLRRSTPRSILQARENIMRSLLLGRPMAPCPCAQPLLRCDPTHSASTSETGAATFELSCVWPDCVPHMPTACRVAVTCRPRAAADFSGAPDPPRTLAHLRYSLQPKMSGVPSTNIWRFVPLLLR